MDKDKDLFLNIDYDIIGDTFCFNSNIKKELIKDIVIDFLRTQIGAGKDASEANVFDLYKIDLQLDLQGDIFNISSNCGNLGFRDGILLRLVNKLS